MYFKERFGKDFGLFGIACFGHRIGTANEVDSVNNVALLGMRLFIEYSGKE